MQEIRLINDSRAPDLRKKELIATIDGMLESKRAGRRVKWERSEVAELTLYIPYQVEISACVYQP